MGLDLWFKEDVARILASSAFSSQAALSGIVAPDQNVAAYRQGYMDALMAVAMAFGVMLPSQPPSVSVVNAPQIGDGGYR